MESCDNCANYKINCLGKNVGKRYCETYEPKKSDEKLKIFETEDNVRFAFRRIIPFNFIKNIDKDAFFESFITNVKNYGLINNNENKTNEENEEKTCKLCRHSSFNNKSKDLCFNFDPKFRNCLNQNMFESIKPIENTTNKIQMTEEQADQIYDAFLYKASNEIGRQQFKNELKLNGFIIKSKLKTLVDEAEEMYSKMCMSDQSVTCWGTAEKCYKTLQLLKVNHPEFKNK